MSAVPASLVRAMWLQSIMSRRLVTDKQSRAIYNDACRIVGAPSDGYRDDLSLILKSLSNIGLELRQMQDEVDGRTMVGVVNTKGDQLAQAGTGYLPNELVYIRALIEAIYTAPRSAYSISSMEAIRLASDSSHSKKQREELLANLVRHEWLRKSKGGRYALGTRALMELQTYLKSEYEDNALVCFICNDLITMGHVCATDTPEMSCSVQVHFHCEPRLKQRANQAHIPGKCPECKQKWEPWPFGLLAAEAVAQQSGVGAGLADEEENFDEVEDTQPITGRASKKQRQTRNSNASNGSSSKKKRGKKRARDADGDDSGGDDDDDEEEEDAEVEEEPQQPAASSSRRPTRRRSPRKSGSAGGVRVAGGVELDDEDEDE